MVILPIVGAFADLKFTAVELVVNGLRLGNWHLDLHLKTFLPLHAGKEDELVIGAGFTPLHKGINLGGNLGGFGNGRFFIHRQQFASAEEKTAVAHHMHHIRTLRRIHQPRIHRLRVMAEMRLIMHPIHPHHRHIRTLPRL